MSFDTFVGEWLPQEFQHQDWNGQYWFVRPQTEFLMREGEMLVNELVRLENLAEEFTRIAKVCGLSSALPHVNRSSQRMSHRPRSLTGRLRVALQPDSRTRHEQWTSYYDAQTEDQVGQLYAVDVEAFGYQPPLEGQGAA